MGTYAGLKQLGTQSAIPASPEAAVLERVPNSHPRKVYLARFAAPEFTSLCPITGQPDFAHLVIDYVPAGWLVESKSLKLYLFSFRNQGTFNEEVVNWIARDLFALLRPRWLEVRGDFLPRGGIAIRPSVRLAGDQS
jgi:7-cyano-7-deazaguanine reductase